MKPIAHGMSGHASSSRNPRVSHVERNVVYLSDPIPLPSEQPTILDMWQFQAGLILGICSGYYMRRIFDRV